MKRKALAIVLTLLMLVSVLPMGAFAASETDTTVPAEAETKAASYTDTEGHWGEAAIERWTQAKNSADQAVLEGMGNNTYAPDENLTRAQAMTIFSRLLNLVETADISKVTDVASDAWYAQWIEKGYAYEIIKGTSDTTFDPDGSITREQFFSIFARAMGIPGAEKCDKEFTDLDQVSSWFVEEGTVYAMVNAGYLDGYPDGSLQPKGNITRAEVAQVLANAIDSKGYITADGTYDLTGMTDMVVVLAKNATLTGTYTGHIVSSCVNSTLYTTKVNPSTVKAAVNTAADNVKVSNVGVANPPYTPANPYNPSGANYVYVLQDNTVINPVAGGSGGGGGSSGGNPVYNVTLTLDPPFGNKALELQASNVTSLEQALIGNGIDNDKVVGLIEGDNYDAAVAVIQTALDKLKFKDTEVDGYTVSVDENGVIKVTNPTAAFDLEASMKDVERQWNENMDKACAQLDAAEQDAWNAIRDAFNPYNLFDEAGYTANTMKLLSAKEYADKIADVLTALNDLQKADTNRNFVKELNGILADAKGYAGLDWSSVKYDNVARAIQNSSLFPSPASQNTTTVNISDVASVNTAITNIMGLDVNGDPAIQAIIGAAIKGTSKNHIQGDYSLIVEVKQVQ